MHVLINNESLMKNERFKKFMKGACIQIASGAIAKEKLKHTQAAEKARNTRAKWKNTRIQKGGVLLAREYFAIQQQKEVDALTATEQAAEKAQQKLERERNKIKKQQEIEARKALRLQKKLEKEAKIKAKSQKVWFVLCCDLY